MKTKLLFIVNVDWFFISHRLPVALEALRQGFEVHIATEITDSVEKLQTLGLIVHPLTITRSNTGLISNIRTFFQILSTINKINPDLVHLVTIKPVLLGGIASRITAVPCVVVAISGLGSVYISNGIKATIRRWFIGRIYRVALGHHNSKFIFQNKNDMKILLKLSGQPVRKTELIKGSGVNLSNYKYVPLNNGMPIVVLAARLLADKGVREFVQAAATLKNKGTLARFVLVGDVDPGNVSTITVEEIEQWISQEVVEWWGYRNDIQKVFAKSTIVVLPSYYGEGLPKVLIEAAACGRAVITTDHPGCRDAIDPNVSGLLVPVRDSDALADAIKHLLNSPELCVKMGLAGRRLAEQYYDIDKVCKKHIKIYKSLLAGDT
ncbi:MAG: glycosyltransferase family 4 protein [Candidatus Scalindua sp.]|nr:glycosyltransferase family 4 protein [Candidatus Scalindua sp.]